MKKASIKRKTKLSREDFIQLVQRLAGSLELIEEIPNDPYYKKLYRKVMIKKHIRK
jgi:hypothetical protein